MRYIAFVILLLFPFVNGSGAETIPLGERLARVSERFLGVPYRLGPLGEGPDGEFDRDPLADFKAMDCTTFIEETMALAIEGDSPRAFELLRKIRYKDGVVSYETRNHFPEADWIPNNIQAGYLRDITREIAGKKTRTASKLIRKSAWYERKGVGELRGFENVSQAEREQRVLKWRSLGKSFPDKKVSLDYLPLELLPSLLPKISSGTIVNLVRQPRKDQPVMVTHQVFIFDGPKGKIVRHAASGKSVEDMPVLEYFSRYRKSNWKLLGLNLNAVLDPREDGPPPAEP